MAIDRDLLNKALRELVQLRTAANDPKQLVARLYTAASEGSAGRLGIGARKLNKLVLINEILPTRRLH